MVNVMSGNVEQAVLGMRECLTKIEGEKMTSELLGFYSTIPLIVDRYLEKFSLE